MSRVPGHVLVIDDQEYVRESLAAILTREGHAVRTAVTAEEALADLARHPADAVLTDLQLPGADGLEVVESLAHTAPDVPVVVLTGHGTVASAVAAMKSGAFDYLEKPADPEALLLVIGRALAWRRLQREVEILRRTTPAGADAPVGESPAWRRALALAHAAAGADSGVLLLGESGSGKEVLAREIHRRSNRAAAPFVPVNCAAIPIELFESEFFGHVKGAFTGAATNREGRFRLAHEGTLFLDEVTCLPSPAQAKLLRVLQDGVFERVGDARPLSANVRVIAATNSDLDADVARGAFRQDLLYRLDVVRIRVPPLRERTDDIPLLAARFLARRGSGALAAVRSLSPEALRQLCAYEWPGNVRELENVLERALILERSAVLTPSSLPFGERRGGTAPAADGTDLTLREVALRAEKQAILRALRASGGVRAEAARLLGVDPRNLSHYLRKHGIQEG